MRNEFLIYPGIGHRFAEVCIKDYNWTHNPCFENWWRKWNVWDMTLKAIRSMWVKTITNILCKYEMLEF